MQSHALYSAVRRPPLAWPCRKLCMFPATAILRLSCRERRTSLVDIPSRSDLFSIGRSYVLDRATRIDPNQVDVQGSDVNVIVGSQSVVAYQLSKQLAYRTAAL